MPRMGKASESSTLTYILNRFGLDPSNHLPSPISVPDWGREKLASLFAELGFSKGAEIGVKRGEYSQVLCKANPDLHLYAVDAWTAYSGYRPGRQAGMEVYFKEATERLAPYNCTLVRKFSVDAARSFADDELDFVYIDSCHDFVSVVNDIHEWSRVVRPSGVIAGHDFIPRGPKPGETHNSSHRVIEAVTGYTQSYGIDPYFVLGRKEGIPGEVRDLERSWLWVK